MTTLIQTNEKDREFAELQQQFQKALAERNDLKIKLKTKTIEYDEIQKTNETLKNEKKLQERIATVEKEKNRLQARLRMVEAEIIRLKSEMKEQKEENRKRLQAVENKNEKLEEENQKLSKNLQKVGEEVKDLRVEMKDLAKATKDHKEENRELKTAIAANYSEQTVALLHLGELCRQIQNSMYKRILPKHFSSGLTYQVISIEEDIEDPYVVNTESERVEAAGNLQELKKNLKWDVVGRAVKLLQSSRNTKAHPSIDEISLREYAMVLHDQGQLKGRLSLERVNEIIDIWKGLKQEE